jgi:nicotinamidase-related amidase
MLTYKDRKIPETLAEIVTPSHTAVIVHDMQKDNIGEGGAYDKVGRRIDVSRILPSMVRFLEDARAHRAGVMYTQYTNLPDWGAFADVWVRDLLLHPDPAKEQVFSTLVGDTPGWPTVDALAPRPGEIVIRKYRVDAFIATPFEYLLRLNKIRTIIHTGIATEVGILPTAWHALNLGFFVVVPEDCVGPMEPEHHEGAMAFLRRLAIVTTSEAIVKAWKESAGR